MPFAKGKSGNPGGRPKDVFGLRDLAREHTPVAIATLVKIMKNEKAPAQARISASIALLDRGYGKAAQSVELSGPNGGDIPVKHDIQDIAKRIAFIFAGAQA